jgi:5'(3')-deoxyribonucleotidase
MNPRIGCDLDSIIAAFDQMAIDTVHEILGDCPGITLENWTSWNLADCFGKEADEALAKAMQTPEFWRKIEPLPGATRELMRLMQKYEIHIVTVRPEQFRDLTHDWLCENEIPFDSLTVVHSSKDKLGVAQTLQCVAFVDDNQDTIETMRDAGMVVGQLAWPWNHGGNGIIRTQSWAALALGIDHQLSGSKQPCS